MVVKSVFVRPFSVMHPKFILVDRKLAFMPSCNVSCVDWFEGCIEMRGDIVGKLFDFWSAFWSRGGASLPSLPLEYGSPSANEDTSLAELSNVLEYNIFSKDILPTTTILLPSPHHANPRFISFQPAPATPLNIFLLQSFKLAKSTLFLITPNITSKPVINALFSALKRGVDVHLVTSSRLMILEQLVTAGTITEFEIWKLRRRYRKLLSMYHRASSTDADPENPMEKPGGLKVGYYHAKRGIQGGSEPVKTHLKLLIVDEEITVLGSGNQDRASWYTSQELGVAFLDACIANDVRKTSDQALEGRVDYIC
jgi:phosphatidylserine/phosphatidylglycerophosphate/cardiolipin synthase-like enzyme